MTPTPIYRDHTGWREKNPHHKPKYIDQVPYIESESNKLWLKFERSVKYFEFPSAPDVELGVVVMAELRWQYYGCKTGGSGPFWLDVKEDEYRLYKSYEHFKSFYENHRWGKTETRQIWVLSEQETKEEQPKEIWQMKQRSYRKLFDWVDAHEYDYNLHKNFEEFSVVHDAMGYDTRIKPAPQDTAEEAAIKYAKKLDFQDKNIEKVLELGFKEGTNYQSTKDAKEIVELREEVDRLKESLLKIVHGSIHDAYTTAKEALKVKP